ncbi:MAG: TolC family protein [candidate division Zixibacteria bacterium]|nr:TolC family protein [candidate division Zixibacteria bacterium]MDH3938863.1 TolC family protein [candidate division Zixibacteria bacterium]
MKSFLVTLVITGLLIPALGSTAQAESLTLDDCVNLALQNRASIIRARGNEDLAKADRRAALGAFLPRVNAYYNYSKSYSRDLKSEGTIPTGADLWVDTLQFQDSRTGQIVDWEVVRDSVTGWETVEFQQQDQDRTSKTWGAQAQMSLFDLSNWFNLARSGAAKEMAQLDVIASEQDLIYSVKFSFYAYLAVAENVSVQQEAVKRSDEQLKLIQSKFELGSAAKSDVLKQKVQVGNDRLQLLEAQNSVITAKADLAYTIGIDPTRDIEFSKTSTPQTYDGTIDDALQYGLSHQPAYLSAEKGVDASNHSVNAAKAAYLPTLGASASLGWSDGTRGDTAIFNFSSRSSSIGLGASWSIFDGFYRERSLSSAKIQRNNARAQAAEMRNLLALQVKTAFYDIENAQAQTQVSQENVEAATEDLNITQEKYNLGAATILDLLESQVALKNAQVSLIRTGFDLNLAVARLDRAMGRKL